MAPLKSIGDVAYAILRMSRLRDEIRERRAELDEYKKAVMAYMDANQMTTFMASDGCSATYYKGRRKRLDVTRLAVEQPDIYAKYLLDEERNQLYFKVR